MFSVFARKCAWWDKDEKRCAIPQIPREIERLADRVQDLNIDFRDQLGNLQMILNKK